MASILDSSLSGVLALFSVMQPSLRLSHALENFGMLSSGFLNLFLFFLNDGSGSWFRLLSAFSHLSWIRPKRSIWQIRHAWATGTRILFVERNSLGSLFFAVHSRKRKILPLPSQQEAFVTIYLYDFQNWNFPI